MKKQLLAFASIACLGMFAAGCDGDDTDPCEDYDCPVGQECRVQSIFFINTASCTATAETCQALGTSWELKNHPTKGFICVDNGSEGGSGTTDDGSCYENADCEEDIGEVCETDTGWCVINSDAEDEYRYVRVDDLSPLNNNGEDPGADIDAIVLVKAGTGATYYVNAVKGYGRGNGESTKETGLDHAFNPDAIIGAPDSVVDYTNPNGKCNYLNSRKDGYTFVSLGGENGFVIGEMGNKIENGDSLYVIEVGNCTLDKTTTQSGKSSNAKAEEFKVSASVSYNVESDWKVIINSSTATKGVVKATVAGLD